MFSIKDGITADDFPALLRLSEVNLGKDYLPESYFQKVIRNKRYHSWKVYSEQGTLIAFLVAYQTDKDEVLSYTKEPKLLGLIDDNLYCLDTMAVNSNYKRQGIGKKLIRLAISTLGENAGFIMYTWKQGDTINMEKIASLFSFVPLKEFPGFWKKSCDKGEFSCPARENKQCNCSMVFFYRRY